VQTEHDALAGLRVVEFTAGMAGPWIGRYMAWCGAEVVRVESRKIPGVVRLYIPPDDPERRIQPTLSPWFTDWDAGKLFVSIDLNQPDAVALAKRLVARADIVVENYRAGVMDKLGLGYDVLSEINPSLILLSSSGFGEGGPQTQYITWGPNIEAISGLAHASGFPERACTMTQYAYPDSLSALHGLFAILAALDHRDRTGEGQAISLSQFETTTAMLGPQLMQALAGDAPTIKLGNTALGRAPHGCYACTGEDRWCVISVDDEVEWQALCAVAERPDWQSDPRFSDLHQRIENRAALDAEIESWTQALHAEDVMTRLQAASVPAGVVQTTEDQFLHDEHLAERGYFERIPHLVKGEVVATGIPLGLTLTPGRTRRAGADFGEDNAYVFRDLLGLSSEAYAQFVASGAIESED
jgi:benzylsuccinate CoA-transferase BbsF subunit